MHRNSISCTCQMCGATFSKKASAVARGGGKYCSRSCKDASIRHTTDDIWAMIDQSGGPDACWPFTGYCKPKGYGAVSFNGRVWEVHRLVYVLTNGEPEPGQIVRHTCDNPPCANPAHLVIGTLADNMFDRRDRGRYALGEAHQNAKLTDDDVRTIRAMRKEGHSYQSIADAVSVSHAAIWLVVNGRSWKHVQ